MRYTLLTLIAALASLASWAVEVNCTPGALEQQVTDHSITALTVTGQMDARDFLFVADSLKQLNSIDLSNVEIVAYTSIKPIFGTTTHHLPMTLPTASLAGKPLTSVALPDGLKTIGEAAFAGCDKLVSIALPQQLDTIGNYAFGLLGAQHGDTASHRGACGQRRFRALHGAHQCHRGQRQPIAACGQ